MTKSLFLLSVLSLACSAAGVGRGPEMIVASEPVEFASAGPQEPAPQASAPEDDGLLPAAREGARLAAGWGLHGRIPNDRTHIWAFEDRSAWPLEERQLVERAGEALNEVLPWTILRDDQAVHSAATDVIVRYDLNPPSSSCIETGSAGCWFGSTGCVSSSIWLGDEKVCDRWLMNLSVQNIHAWADLQADPDAAFSSALGMVWQHELGHSLGFPHESAGIMQTFFNWTTLRGESPVDAAFTECDVARLGAFERWAADDVDSIQVIVPDACAN